MPSDTGHADHPYARLGLRPFINWCGTRTVHGGSLMPPEVVTAMAQAADRFVSMAELMQAAGRRIAALTGAEAALVTSGGAAALGRRDCRCHQQGRSRTHAQAAGHPRPAQPRADAEGRPLHL